MRAARGDKHHVSDALMNDPRSDFVPECQLLEVVIGEIYGLRLDGIFFPQISPGTMSEVKANGHGRVSRKDVPYRRGMPGVVRPCDKIHRVRNVHMEVSCTFLCVRLSSTSNIHLGTCITLSVRYAGRLWRTHYLSPAQSWHFRGSERRG